MPVRDEEGALLELGRRVRETLDRERLDFELILVNDGSRDRSLDRIREMRAADARVKLVDLSRNFGHQIAVSAGLDHARGRAVVVMDADLQDPPELIPELVARWREGHEVVYGVRRARKEGLARRLAYATFYRLLRRITQIDVPLDAGDFSLMDRRVVDLLISLPERNRFVRGLRAWLGFRQIGVPYDRDERASGESKYGLRELVRLAFDGIFAFSELPLRFARDLGLLITGGAGILALWTLGKRIFDYEVVPGFATLAILVLFFGGVQLITVGVLGEYIARIYTEVKARPLYVVRELAGLGPHDRDRDGDPDGEALGVARAQGESSRSGESGTSDGDDGAASELESAGADPRR